MIMFPLRSNFVLSKQFRIGDKQISADNTGSKKAITNTLELIKNTVYEYCNILFADRDIQNLLFHIYKIDIENKVTTMNSFSM